MKRLIMVAAALALMSTASSAAPTKKEVFDLFMLNYDCGWFGWTEELEQEQEKACKALERAVKKLNAQGYCFYGHGSIGRNGRPYNQKELERLPPGDWKKGRKHCFYLKEKKDARILQFIEKYESEKPYIRVWKERCKKNPALPVCENNGWKGDVQ